MTVYQFETMLKTSLAAHDDRIRSIIQARLQPFCDAVRPATAREDRSGADYVATLTGGRCVLVDVKIRAAGCRRYWIDGPEVALEYWSKVPSGNAGGAVGWTRDPRKTTDYVLFIYDPADTMIAFFVPFHSLRHVFEQKWSLWSDAYGGQVVQNSSAGSTGNRWQSSCIFVPAHVVLDAIRLGFIHEVWSQGGQDARSRGYPCEEYVF